MAANCANGEIYGAHNTRAKSPPKSDLKKKKKKKGLLFCCCCYVWLNDLTHWDVCGEGENKEGERERKWKHLSTQDLNENGKLLERASKSQSPHSMYSVHTQWGREREICLQGKDFKVFQIFSSSSTTREKEKNRNSIRLRFSLFVLSTKTNCQWDNLSRTINNPPASLSPPPHAQSRVQLCVCVFACVWRTRFNC